MLDLDAVKASLAGAEETVPAPILEPTDVLTCDTDRLPRDSSSILMIHDWVGTEANVIVTEASQSVERPRLENSIPDDVEDLFRNRYGLTGEIWNDRWTELIPAVAGRLLALSDTLSIEELEFALDALEPLVHYRATVAVTNSGPATAKAVQISAPEHWRATGNAASAFDLPQGVNTGF